MTTNGTSKPSVKATTGLDGTEVDGSRPETRVIYHGSDWRFSRAAQANYARWLLIARLKHLLKIHTWVDVESWRIIDGVRSPSVVGKECWLCPARR